MPSAKLKENNGLLIRLRYLSVWLSAREDLPINFITGGFSSIKLLRFSLAIISLISFSSVALGSPVWSSASYLGLWYGIVSSGYIIVAMIFLLGLRMWYGASVGFSLLSSIINLALDERSGFHPLGTWGATDLNNLVALGWIYLVLCGLFMMRYDKGSKINEMLVQS